MKFDLRLPFLAFLAALACVANLAADWQPYHARYAVYRNGSQAGDAEITLQQHGDRWVMHSAANGTQGLARILGAVDAEHVEGRFMGGRFRPDEYSHHTRVAGIDRDWTARFDWPNNTVNIILGKAEKAGDALTLSLGDGALDPLSLKLELQRRLRDQEGGMVFYLVDDDQIKKQDYRILQTEKLESGLGCLDTIPVERIRTNSTRYTRAWHAPQFEFIPVRLEHGKTDGDHMEMHISELVLGQKTVQALPGCAASQELAGQP